MAFNAAISSYSNGLNVQATPTRDRDRLPFPQSANPSPGPSLRQTPSSSVSGSFSNSQSSSTSNSAPVIQVSPQNITVEALLRQHASSPDPTAAALDQAVTDRNVLSSQNTQLWKLIEKQRAGYNQILKELERIRGERDSYKSRLTALNALPNGTSEKRQKMSSERGSRPSLDTVSISSSHTSTTSSSHANSQSRPAPRHNSDDAATPRNLHHQQLQASRSFDPISIRSNDNKIQSNASDPAIITPIRSSSPPPGPPLSTPATPARQSRPSPSPLVVPNSVDTLAAYSISDSPESSVSTKPPGFVGDTTTNIVNPNGIYSSTSTRPLVHPRKASLADSVSSVYTFGSSVSSTSSAVASGSSANHNFGTNPNTPSYQYAGHTPTAASAGFNAPPIFENSFARPRGLGPAAASNITIQPPPPIMNSPPNPAPSPLSQPPISHSQVSTQGPTLSVALDNRPHFLSRDSRISLPDEASRYIQNMGDSPAASPRVELFSPKSKLSNSVFPLTSNGVKESGRESEFLDMDDEDESDEGSEDGEEAGNVTAGAIDPDIETSNYRAAPSRQENNTNDGNEAYPAYQYPQPVEIMNNYSSNSSREDVDAVQGKRKEKSRVGAEEFPLPPPSNSYMQRQQVPAGQEVQPHLYAQNPLLESYQVQPSLSVLTSSPAKHPQAIADHNLQYRPSLDDKGSYTSMQESAYTGQPSAVQRSESSSQKQEGTDAAAQGSTASFRALPLLSSDLPHTTINVSHSFVRPNDRGKEVLSFIVFVNPGHGKDGWKVEKMYSDVLSLDQRVRNSVGKGVGKKIANLPEGKLWKDHAPAKVDQRKAVLENYLQTLIQLPVKNNDEVIAFFTSDIIREQKQAVMQVGHKEGYLTKKGKNFGGWKTRFFVLQGPVLEYYDCRGGAHLGSITITGAQIARQHRTERPPNTDDETEYRHAFLIVEAKKGPGGSHPRHVLCAESDEDRDSWVEMLVRYYTGTYSEEMVFNASSGLTSVQSNSVVVLSQQSQLGQPRSSTSSSDISLSTPRSKPIARGLSRDEVVKGSALPISLLPPDAANAKLLQSGPSSEDYLRSSSPSKSVDPSPIDRHGPSAAGGFDISKRMMDRSLGLPSSLPDSSPLSNIQTFQPDGSTPGQRSNSELGHYPDLQDLRGANRGQRQHSPEQHRTRDDGRKSFYPTLNTVSPSPTTNVVPPPDREPSPEKLDAAGKVKISGPMNGAPIPSGFKFGGKDAPSADPSQAANDRREKAKSRSFWGFGKANGDKSQLHAAYPPRAVFGVPLEEALDVAQICNLPAIVFRSIQYLEAKKADQEEGIYRLSGSSAVIKNLKDMFNNEGDIDLLASDEYWDPHAIAGLLKSFLRELPSSILTRDLHLKFLAVIDFVDPQERIRELSQLISALPLANYSLLRALTAHLILIVQNSNVNKMTMRNVGIVFSPTLGIPAGVFSLMLGEFNRVFNVDADNDEADSKEGDDLLENSSEPLKRNSRQYTDAAADQLLGLSGRTLKTSAEENQSDGDDFSIQDESGTETTEGEPSTTRESSSSSPASAQNDSGIRIHAPDSPITPTPARTSKAANAAASKGLNVAVAHSDRGNRHSRMIGLPSSPRPTTQSPTHPDIPMISDTSS